MGVIEHREKLSNYATVPHHRVMFARGYIASRELKPYTASLISNEYYVLV